MDTVGKFEVMSHKLVVAIFASGQGTIDVVGRFTFVGEKPRKSCWSNYGLYRYWNNLFWY